MDSEEPIKTECSGADAEPSPPQALEGSKHHTEEAAIDSKGSIKTEHPLPRAGSSGARRTMNGPQSTLTHPVPLLHTFVHYHEHCHVNRRSRSAPSRSSEWGCPLKCDEQANATKDARRKLAKLDVRDLCDMIRSYGMDKLNCGEDRKLADMLLPQTAKACSVNRRPTDTHKVVGTSSTTSTTTTTSTTSTASTTSTWEFLRGHRSTAECDLYHPQSKRKAGFEGGR